MESLGYSLRRPRGRCRKAGHLRPYLVNCSLPQGPFTGSGLFPDPGKALFLYLNADESSPLMPEIQDRLRQIPQVSAILTDERIAPLLRGRRGPWMTRLIQDVLDELRLSFFSARGSVRSREDLHEVLVADVLARHGRLVRPAWTRVLNGTGVVVHTNMGRSNFPRQAAEAARAVAVANSDLEYDLPAGTRGHRGRLVERKAALLAGAPDALVVNNNAAAVWLAVRYASRGGRVVLSRGEVVAIGGSFRMHEILAETGCRLMEVGTTNRTSLEDYRRAIEPGCTVLKVHRSNFEVQGFTEDVPLADLAALCGELEATLIYDAGSGALYPYEELGLPAGERLLVEDVATGADLVTCSGDKLLGGCQAGIIFGSRKAVAGLREHPMRRAFRVDKTTLAALDAVLTLYLEAEGRPDIPTLNQLGTPLEELQERAEALLALLAPLAPGNWRGEVRPGFSSVGGGSFSTTQIESRLVHFEGPKEELETCHRRLRMGNPALVGRMNQEGLAVDVRTLPTAERDLVVTAFRHAWSGLDSVKGDAS
ncbi:L-seryl-tRNA(Sec) selenium transferase [bacterium DOLZORAL124_64_63]|nr:MAG: L-seryl-tRNA(Sec) selenium transferase [bacterium DOLZORAL124_64_63]